jgi:hypothetical protein
LGGADAVFTQIFDLVDPLDAFGDDLHPQVATLIEAIDPIATDNKEDAGHNGAAPAVGRLSAA